MTLKALNVAALLFVRPFERVLHDFIGKASCLCFFGTPLYALVGFGIQRARFRGAGALGGKRGNFYLDIIHLGR